MIAMPVAVLWAHVRCARFILIPFILAQKYAQPWAYTAVYSFCIVPFKAVSYSRHFLNSYNHLNGTHASENKFLLQDVLGGRLGLQWHGTSCTSLLILVILIWSYKFTGKRLVSFVSCPFIHVSDKSMFPGSAHTTSTSH